MPEADAPTVHGDSVPQTASMLDEAIVARRRIDQSANPNIGFVDTITLRENTAGAITADHVQVLNQNTGLLHHSYVKLSHLSRTKRTQTSTFRLQTPKEVIINNEGTDEISALRDFLNVVIDGSMPDEEGKYLLFRVDDDNEARNLSRIRSVVSDTTRSALLIELIETIGNDPDLLHKVTELATTDPNAVKIASAALKLANYSNAIKQLESLVEQNPTESQFQSILDENPWMFGSDYSDLIHQRDLVQGQITDFPLRRTADNCLEIIEIKRPFADELFSWDPSHKSWFPRRDLAMALGQVMGYIDELDAQRDTIWRRHKILVHKVRAKIIIGRDGDESQAEALRRFNSHPNRIEVITFDQLIRISHNVASHLQSVVEDTHHRGSDDGLPF